MNVFRQYFAMVAVVAMFLSSCGSSGGDPTTPPPSGDTGVSTNSSKLYLNSDSRNVDFLSLNSGSADVCYTNAFRLGVSKEFTAVLKGDISGTIAGIQLYLYTVGTTMDASVVLKQGSQEKTLASWTGITTTDSEQYEKVDKSAAIEDPQTAAGDILLLRLTCANTDVFCEIKYGCLENFVTVPSVGSAGVDKPSSVVAQPDACDTLVIMPENIMVEPFDEVEFSADGGTPPYAWAVDSAIGSTIDENGLYAAGDSESLDVVTVTDAGECQMSANVDVSM